MKNYFKLLTSLLFLFSLCGCAVSYIDAAGDQRIIGLVSITLDRPADTPIIAGDKISVSNIGLMYLSSPLHTGLSIGYTNESSVLLKNNVLVLPESNDVSSDEIEKECLTC